MQDSLGKMNFPLLTMVWAVPSGHLWISFLVVNFLRGHKQIYDKYMTLSLNKCYHELNSWRLWQKHKILLTAGLSVVGVGKKLTYSVHRDGKRNSSCHFQSIYAYYISILLKTQNRGAAFHSFASCRERNSSTVSFSSTAHNTTQCLLSVLFTHNANPQSWLLS